MFSKNVLDQIGNTPIVCLKGVLDANIFAKAEHLNPGGSIKDRVALFMLEEAKRKGQLKDGDAIAEPTSGNTGIGMALVGGVMGHQVICVMPENMSEERKKIIRALGAELILTPAEQSLEGCIKVIDELRRTRKNIYVPQQFENPNNPLAHELTTGPEIWTQLRHHVDIFVSGLGSGGTLQGVGKYLKARNKNTVIVAVEPKNVSALLGHEPGLHRIEGIGDGFIPPVLDTSLIDEVVEVTDDNAVETSRLLARRAGLLVGTSAGANVWACMQMARKFGPEKIIATILPDRAERYFSTSLI
ncbi:MAG TPA: cysteine synthase A [Deltaproteobacteria bacterium]|nr:cysteine synthase A [Deltaproteobacteria bacterium]HPR55848.1 cysteine synthase A [Deltaproteobacteria bacterium]HXK48120.1 cysteine synthase A [Deltaproteobacteria bacterium]